MTIVSQTQDITLLNIKSCGQNRQTGGSYTAVSESAYALGSQSVSSMERNWLSEVLSAIAIATDLPIFYSPRFSSNDITMHVTDHGLTELVAWYRQAYN